MCCLLLGPKLKLVSDLSSLNRFVEPPLTGVFCDLLWADPLLEDVLGYKLSDKDFAGVSCEGVWLVRGWGFTES